jgi:hypothetical protein
LLGERDGPEYDWEGTSVNMVKFQNSLVERFLRQKERGDGDIFDVFNQG